MEKTIKIIISRSHAAFICYALMGSILISLGAHLNIPFIPVPFTLQTLSLFILGLTQSPRLAISSTLFYLLWGSLGLPVFPKGANPLWIAGPKAGYLIAFPISAYLISKSHSKTHPLTALLIGQAVIYLTGFLGLIPFVGISTAWMKGVVFFIPSGLLKCLAAAWIANHWNRWRS